MGSSSSIGGNRPEGETSHCRVKHTHTPASTINKKRLRLTADLFIPAASIDRFSQSLSIKVLDDHTEKRGNKQTKPTQRVRFFLILYFSDCFLVLFGERPTPPASNFLYRRAALLLWRHVRLFLSTCVLDSLDTSREVQREWTSAVHILLLATAIREKKRKGQARPAAKWRELANSCEKKKKEMVGHIGGWRLSSHNKK